MLRAYSQGKFNPEAIFDEDISEAAFVDKVEDILRDFIISEIAVDSGALRKEVLYFVIHTCKIFKISFIDQQPSQRC